MQYEQLAPLQADEAVFACGIGTRLGKSHRLLGIPNEDTYTYVTNFFPGDDYFPTLENSSSSPIRSWTFAGVWDGHGGTGASSYCARSMHETLAAILAREYAKAEEDGEAEPGIQVLKNALTEAFLVTETEFNAWARLNRDTSGACSLVAMVSAGDIIIANAGDCCAILLEESRLAQPINKRHSARDPSELTRLQAAGATVTAGRVWNVLEPSRSIGDVDLKGGAMEGGVIAAPDVYHHRVAGKKWALMLATDGLIDSVRHDVIHESLEQLLDKARSWEQTANLLCAKACAQGDDDVTVICMGPIKTSLLAP